MNKKRRKKAPETGALIRTLILSIAIVALAVSVWVLAGKDAFDAWRAQRIEQKTKDLYYSGNACPASWLFPSALAEDEENLAEEDASAEPDLPEIQEDFYALYEANANTVGWLKAGERIDYPVVQKDNWYYLTRNFYGQKDSNGTLFLNQYCALFPRSDVLLIHGHNARSGAMFASLSKYEELDYAREYPLITFRTIYDEQDVYYTPVFAFNASMEEDNAEYVDIARVSFADDVYAEDEEPQGDTERHSSEYQAYLDELAQLSIWQSPVDVNVDDELLILVTCSYYQENGRFLLVCRQLRECETPESITELFAQAE